MSKSHAPKDVYETREDYRCGVCREPVVRYSAPRAVWKHAATTTTIAGVEYPIEPTGEHDALGNPCYAVKKTV